MKKFRSSSQEAKFDPIYLVTQIMCQIYLHQLNQAMIQNFSFFFNLIAINIETNYVDE